MPTAFDDLLVDAPNDQFGDLLVDEPSAEPPVQSLAATAAYSFPKTLSNVATGTVGGIAKMADVGLDVVDKYTGIGKPEIFKTIGEVMDDASRNAAEMYPVDERNPITATVAGGAAQGISLLAGGAAGKALGLGEAALTRIPLALGAAQGANQGIDTARELGVESPEAQLALGALFGGTEVLTEKLGGIGNKAATDALVSQFRKPAGEMLAEAAKSVVGEGGEEIIAGSVQDWLARAFATEDPSNPGFTKTGVPLPEVDPRTKEFLKKRGMEFIGGAAGGGVFAGAQVLANAGKPEAPPPSIESGESVVPPNMGAPDISEEDALDELDDPMMEAAGIANRAEDASAQNTANELRKTTVDAAIESDLGTTPTTEGDLLTDFNLAPTIRIAADTANAGAPATAQALLETTAEAASVQPSIQTPDEKDNGGRQDRQEKGLQVTPPDGGVQTPSEPSPKGEQAVVLPAAPTAAPAQEPPSPVAGAATIPEVPETEQEKAKREYQEYVDREYRPTWGTTAEAETATVSPAQDDRLTEAEMERLRVAASKGRLDEEVARMNQEPRKNVLTDASTPVTGGGMEARLKNIDEDLKFSGVAYDGDTRYSIKQSSDNTFYVERTINGQRESLELGQPDMESARAAAIRVAANQASPDTESMAQDQLDANVGKERGDGNEAGNKSSVKPPQGTGLPDKPVIRRTGSKRAGPTVAGQQEAARNASGIATLRLLNKATNAYPNEDFNGIDPSQISEVMDYMVVLQRQTAVSNETPTTETPSQPPQAPAVQAAAQAGVVAARGEAAGGEVASDVAGFTASMSPMQRGKVSKSLEADRRSNGKIVTVAQIIEREVANGAEVVVEQETIPLTSVKERELRKESESLFRDAVWAKQDPENPEVKRRAEIAEILRRGSYKKEMPSLKSKDGTYRTQDSLSKTGIDYAKYLISKRDATPQETVKSTASSTSQPATVAAPDSGGIRKGEVGGMIADGEVVLTASGRETTPFPRLGFGTDRKTQATVKRVDKWLYDNAVAEAKSRGDSFNARSFEAENPAKMPPASKDSMEEYLFGTQPDVVPSILKPLVKESTTTTPAPKNPPSRESEAGAVATSPPGPSRPVVAASKSETPKAEIATTSVVEPPPLKEGPYKAKNEETRAHALARGFIWNGEDWVHPDYPGATIYSSDVPEPKASRVREELAKLRGEQGVGVSGAAMGDARAAVVPDKTGGNQGSVTPQWFIPGRFVEWKEGVPTYKNGQIEGSRQIKRNGRIESIKDGVAEIRRTDGGFSKKTASELVDQPNHTANKPLPPVSEKPSKPPDTRTIAPGDSIKFKTEGKVHDGKFLGITKDGKGYTVAFDNGSKTTVSAHQINEHNGGAVVEGTRFSKQKNETDPRTDRNSSIDGRAVSVVAINAIREQNKRTGEAILRSKLASSERNPENAGRTTGETLDDGTAEQDGVLLPASFGNDKESIQAGGLQFIDECGESAAYADRKNGVVYKVYPRTPDGGVVITPQIKADGGKLTVLDVQNPKEGTMVQALEKIEVINSLGGTPTEVVGLLGDGSLVVKQPLASTEVSSDASIKYLGSIGVVPVKLGTYLSEPYLALVNGKPYILTDIRVGNLVNDTRGNPRILDLNATPLPQKFESHPAIASALARIRGQTASHSKARNPSYGFALPASRSSMPLDKARAHVFNKLRYSPRKVRVINEPSMEFRGRYDPDGTIVLNTAYLGSIEELNDVLHNHEAIHDAVETDEGVRKQADKLLGALTEDELTDIEADLFQYKDSGFSEADLQAERQVEAIRKLTANRPDLRSAWGRLVESVSLKLKRMFGGDVTRQQAELVAARIVARGLKRLRKGKTGGRIKGGTLYGDAKSRNQVRQDYIEKTVLGRLEGLSLEVKRRKASEFAAAYFNKFYNDASLASLGVGRTSGLVGVRPGPAGEIRLGLDYSRSSHPALANGNAEAFKQWVADSVDEELIHTAELLGLRKRWEDSGKNVPFDQFANDEQKDLFADMMTSAQESETALNASLASYNLYAGGNKAQTLDQLMKGIAAEGFAGMQRFSHELVRQIVQINRTGGTTETGWIKFTEVARRWVDYWLNALKLALPSIKSGAYGDLVRDRISETEAVLAQMESGDQLFAVSPSDVTRFKQLTASIPKKPTAEQLETWKQEHPAEYKELEAMRERVLREQGYVEKAYHGRKDSKQILPAPNGIFLSTKEVASGYGKAKPYMVKTGKVVDYDEFLYADEGLQSVISNRVGRWTPEDVAAHKQYADIYDLESGAEALDSNATYALQKNPDQTDVDGFWFLGDEVLGNLEGDSVVRDYTYGGGVPSGTKEYIVFSPSQIKSADPLATDDSGNLITPESWGDETSPDIRYSLIPNFLRRKAEPVTGRERRGQAFGQPEIAQIHQQQSTTVARQAAQAVFHSAGTPVTPESRTTFLDLMRTLLDPRLGPSLAQDLIESGNDMAPVALQDEMATFALRAAAEGDVSLLNMFLNNVNRMSTGTDSNVSKSARELAMRRWAEATQLLGGLDGLNEERDKAGVKSGVTSKEMQALQAELDAAKVKIEELLKTLESKKAKGSGKNSVEVVDDVGKTRKKTAKAKAKKGADEAEKSLEEKTAQSISDEIANRLSDPEVSAPFANKKKEVINVVRELAKTYKGGTEEALLRERLAELPIPAQLQDELVKTLNANLEANKVIRSDAQPTQTAQAIVDGYVRRFTPNATAPQENRTKTRIEQALRMTAPTVTRQQVQDTLKQNLLNNGVAEPLADSVAKITADAWQLRRSAAIEEAVEKVSAKWLLQQILKADVNMQQSPNWRQDMMAQWLSLAGFTAREVELAVKVLDKPFSKALADVRVEAAERYAEQMRKVLGVDINGRARLKKAVIPAIERVQNALRAGSFEGVSTEMAKWQGWKPLSAAEIKRLNELDSLIKAAPEPKYKGANPPHYVLKATHEMFNIFKQHVSGSTLENMAIAFHLNLLSGLPTAGVNIIGPPMKILTDAAIDIARAGATLDIARFQSIANALKTAATTYFKEGRFTAKYDISDRYGVTEITTTREIANINYQLDKWLSGLKQAVKDKSPTGVLKGVFGISDIVRRFLTVADTAGTAAVNAYSLIMGAHQMAKDAGVSTANIKSMFSEARVEGQRAYGDAIMAGYSPEDADTAAIDAQRAAVLGGIYGFVSPEKAFLLDRMSRQEGFLAIGRKPVADDLNTNYKGEETTDVKGEALEGGLISRHLFGVAGMNDVLEMISRFKYGGNTPKGKALSTVLGTLMYGLVHVPYRASRHFATYSPYGFIRYGVKKMRDHQGKDNWFKQSMATPEQEQTALWRAAAGTALMALIASLFRGSDEPEEKDKDYITVTGNGPPTDDPQVRDAWIKQGNQPYHMRGRLFGVPFNVNIGRGGEVALFAALPFAVADDLAIRDKIRGYKSKDYKVSDITDAFSTYMAAISQKGGMSGLLDLSGKNTTPLSSGKGIAAAVSNYAANIIPLNRLIQTTENLFITPPDKSTVETTITANIPLARLGNFPALNRMGDPVGDAGWLGKISYMGVPLPIDVEPTEGNKKVYEVIHSKMAAPGRMNRVDVEKKYGELTNRQWYDFVKASGGYLSKRITDSHDKLMKMNAGQVDDWMADVDKVARVKAANGLGLRVVKVSTVSR